MNGTSYYVELVTDAYEALANAIREGRTSAAALYSMNDMLFEELPKDIPSDVSKAMADGLIVVKEAIKVGPSVDLTEIVPTLATIHKMIVSLSGKANNT